MKGLDLHRLHSLSAKGLSLQLERSQHCRGPEQVHAPSPLFPSPTAVLVCAEASSHRQIPLGQSRASSDSLTGDTAHDDIGIVDASVLDLLLDLPN